MTESRERRDVGGTLCGEDTESTVDTDTLSVLADDTALAVLAALDEPRTAREVAADGDLGLSTVYRKLERLTGADLCEERVTVRSDGCRVSRYRRTVDGLCVEVGDGDLAVEAVARTPADAGRHERDTGVDRRVGAVSD